MLSRSAPTWFVALSLVAALSGGCAYSRPEAVEVPKDAPAAPPFELPDQQRAAVSLAQLRATGPVVLVFYRGDWCPYCRAQLDRIQARLGELQATDARVVAITVDTPDQSLALAKKRGYQFPILQDEAGRIGSQYGVWDKEAELHLPATFIVDREGKIRLRYVGEGKRDRVTVDQVLAVLKDVRT